MFTGHINGVRDLMRIYLRFDPFPPAIYYFKDIPTHTSALTVAIIAGGAVVCSLIFSALPALRAARLDPVQCLYYE